MNIINYYVYMKHNSNYAKEFDKFLDEIFEKNEKTTYTQSIGRYKDLVMNKLRQV